MAMYMMREMLGWSASAILVMTIVQVAVHRADGGVDRLLVYSWLIKDPIFLFTNALMMISALAGLGPVLWHRSTHPLTYSNS
jgi:hypothetical protein